MKKYSISITNDYPVALLGICITFRTISMDSIRDTNFFLMDRKDGKLKPGKDHCYIASPDEDHPVYERETTILKIFNIDFVKDSLTTNLVLPNKK